MFDFEFSHQALLTFFSQYAYEPAYVYGFIVLFMFASSFGLPVPEELVLVTSGLVAFMAQNPDKFPPPYEGAQGVSLLTLSVVCFFAVFMSDLIVFLIGKYFGTKIIKTKFFKKQMSGRAFDTINSWFQKYGGWACGIFRFTPGLRFPGHMSCGLLGIPVWKFAMIDGLAALVSVPTQVYFVATYGEVILDKIAEFKLIAASVIGVFILIWLVRKLYQKFARA
jgi:membrane protein DedA with SNARE-associated domain